MLQSLPHACMHACIAENIGIDLTPEAKETVSQSTKFFKLHSPASRAHIPKSTANNTVITNFLNRTLL